MYWQKNRHDTKQIKQKNNGSRATFPTYNCKELINSQPFLIKEFQSVFVATQQMRTNKVKILTALSKSHPPAWQTQQLHVRYKMQAAKSSILFAKIAASKGCRGIQHPLSETPKPCSSKNKHLISILQQASFQNLCMERIKKRIIRSQILRDLTVFQQTTKESHIIKFNNHKT